jgi:hypothetical protein
MVLPGNALLPPIAFISSFRDNIIQIDYQGAAAMLSDTHPDAEKVQLELIRKASVAKRISLMRSLTSMLVTLSRNNIAKSNPGISSKEVKLRWVEYNYGKPLAEELRAYLTKVSYES